MSKQCASDGGFIKTANDSSSESNNNKLTQEQNISISSSLLAKNLKDHFLGEGLTLVKCGNVHGEMKYTCSEDKALKVQIVENRLEIEKPDRKKLETEGEEFKDKDASVTAAKDKNLEEKTKSEKQNKRHDYMHAMGSVKKPKLLDDSHHHTYEQKPDTSNDIKLTEHPPVHKNERKYDEGHGAPKYLSPFDQMFGMKPGGPSFSPSTASESSGMSPISSAYPGSSPGSGMLYSSLLRSPSSYYPTSPKYTASSPGGASPNYSPISPNYSPFSPVNLASSPIYSATAAHFKQQATRFLHSTSGYSPSSPDYSPTFNYQFLNPLPMSSIYLPYPPSSTKYIPSSSPKYIPSSPNYTPTSPIYSPPRYYQFLNPLPMSSIYLPYPPSSTKYIPSSSPKYIPSSPNYSD